MTNKDLLIIKKMFILPWPLKDKLFCLLRYITAPFNEMEKMVPKKGKILDIGCGHGLFELILKSKSNKRVITAIDPDSKKIQLAKKIEELFTNLKFSDSTTNLTNNNYQMDCCILSDVDYLLDGKGKTQILQQAKFNLKNTGTIIFKTVINNGSIGYYLGYLQELIIVSLLKKTYSKKNNFTFFTIEEYLKLFKANNLSVKKQKKLKTLFYHPHYVFLLKKIK
ncbi:MAG TPA: class I SAM-dependent methyltransferase [Candidatus Woesebacteria bacterium]|nr:class I SAM-dependent methyltransferase [Candidatus Woesebacteria bacterium]